MGLDMPRNLQIEFSRVVQSVTDETSQEISATEIWSLFEKEYLSRNQPFDIIEHWSVPDTNDHSMRRMTATVRIDGKERTVNGVGNGPIAAFVNALAKECGVEIRVVDYTERSMGHGADATAVAFVEGQMDGVGSCFGVAIHPNIVIASLRATCCAVNRLLAMKQQ